MMETPASRLEKMRLSSRELAMEWFGQERFAEEYETLYGSLLRS
jgi:hypothetical protein